MPTHSPTGQKQSLAVEKIGQKPFFNALAEKIEGATRADSLVGAPEPKPIQLASPHFHISAPASPHSNF